VGSWRWLRFQPLDFLPPVGGSGALSPDGRSYAFNHQNGTISLCDSVTAQIQAVFASKQHYTIRAVTFSPDGKLMVSVNVAGYVQIWDVASRREIQTFRGQMAGVEYIAFSPDGQRLATGGMVANEAVRLWDWETRKEVLTLGGEGANFWYVTFSPDGHKLVAVNRQGLVHLWRAPSWAEIEAAEKAQAITRTKEEQ
jgi:WD40 repeat protein